MSYINEILGADYQPRYLEDTKRIQKVALDHGVVLTLQQAEAVWILYSDSLAAGWLLLPKSDEEIWRCIS